MARFLGRDLPQDRLFVVAGPCVIESEALALETAERLQETCARLGIALVYKSSYRKANRSDVESYTGPGPEEGLRILSRVREASGLPILTDVHETGEVARAAAVADVLQIPAFLCRQTALLQEAAARARAVNVKKGQFLAPEDMERALEKLRAVRSDGEFWTTERGTSFGYRDLVVDMRGIETMRRFSGTVVFDVTHSLQHPGAGGERRFARPLARAALAAGADGLFLETHPDPDRARSDPKTQLPLAEVPDLLEEMRDWKRLAAEQVTRGRM
ncbi:MAG: 3-deoxy-8-phosphooctulonate synthase [Candidatus Eisenbacteria bacterium]|nr:3-deoxy-8-phosphooctulonate synthase [Candidatus Latescibacterota bacterium]MBD3302583.1 3-deoxy-8-phosphooctulonate synthase [Candidatus Eisenbacteria bacterium]